MNLNIGYQLFLFAVYCFCGVLTGFLFDTFRISRKLIKTNVLTTSLEDIFFWIITSLVVFIISLKFNDGEIRWYMFAGMLIGAGLYLKTISKFIISLFVFLIIMIKNIIVRILKIIFFPVKLIINLLNKPVFFVLSFGKK
ncbi:MAG: spore cortex biosynthesis protein YabQ, partial [Clostridia bacterium]|nr:spore cortex biosynthesis protein YabQ [Clostridia bacterium]